MRPVRLFALVLTVVLAIGTATAYAWYADFFYDEANGNGTYEAGFINPEAVYSDRGTPADTSDDKTFVVFQGPDLDPYIAAVDNEGDWEGPKKIGENQLSTLRPIDTHGGPSIVIDTQGYLHVFYGGHNTKYLQHAVSQWKHSIVGTWTSDEVSIEGEADYLKATYPQPWVLDDGRIGLVFRRGDGLNPSRKMDWDVIFRSNSSVDPTWTPAQTLVDDTDGADEFYVSTAGEGDGTLHVGMIRRDAAESGSDPFIRKDVYYMLRDADGGFHSASGASVEPTPTVDDLNLDALVEDTGSFYANQLVVSVDPGTGEPALLYLKGSQSPVPSYQWTFKRFNGDDWDDPYAGLPGTDNGFDAGDLWFAPNGDAYAYVTTGGLPDDQATLEELKYATRGGDLKRYELASGASSWGSETNIKKSLDASERYNNPQVYAADDTGNSPGVLFTEWNNDNSSFIHKLFLYRNDAFVGRDFTAEVTRLAGANRIETSVKISREAFPSGTTSISESIAGGAIVLASSQDYADALCGVPLAQSYHAPVLLCPPGVDSAGKLPSTLETEIKRLKPSKVILLGGDKALSSAVATRLKQLRSSATIQRFAGANRYETSLKIARELAARKGLPNHVMLASGANFADALAASPYAARRGIPVLLTTPTALPPATATALRELLPDTVVVVGGPVAVSPQVEAAAKTLAPYTDRWAGTDRYDTARVLAGKAIAAGHKLERPVIASGATFADAVPGGLLAARVNSVVVLTAPGALPASSAATLRQATSVLEAYVLGGEVAVSPGVENAVTGIVRSEGSLLSAEK